MQALPAERGNMIMIQCWNEEEPEDMHLGLVADIMLANYQDVDQSTDVRLNSKQVSDALADAVARNVASHVVVATTADAALQEPDRELVPTG